MANGPGCLHDPCSDALCEYVHELESALAEADADRLVKQARIEELERALRPTPERPDIHWEDGTEGAHYASPGGGCCPSPCPMR